MSYRDDLEAAHARIRALEMECERLRGAASPATPPLKREPTPHWRAVALEFLKIIAVPFKVIAVQFVEFSRLGVVVFAFTAMLIFWVLCFMNYFTRPCAQKDNICLFVRSWPPWLHVIGVSFPIVLLVGWGAVNVWREAKRRVRDSHV